MSESRRERSALAALAGAIVWGGLLRLEALIQGYGAVPGPNWFTALQRLLARLAARLRPDSIVWDTESAWAGDPVAYLQHGRAMTWFYEGRAREPVFNYVTHWYLRLVDNADIAVSLASATFSLLCVVAVYLLGRLAFGRIAGLLAAYLLAIDPLFIQWGVDGWRDDTFTFGVLMFVAAAVAFDRSPDRPRGWLLGLTGAFVTLTRLTSVSFIGPVWALLAWRAWRRRTEGSEATRGLLIALCLMIVLVSPYLITCWIEFGDPLISINRNTNYYRSRAGIDASEPMDASSYLRERIVRRPARMAHQVSAGFTDYAFENKWSGLRDWHPRLRRLVRLLSIVGLGAWLWTRTGRLLLLATFTALLPYVFTWEISSEWRFTMHVYPLFLMAFASAAVLLSTPIVAPVSRAIERFRPDRARHRALGKLALKVAISAALLAAIAYAPDWFAPARLTESIRVGETADIQASGAMENILGEGWFEPVVQKGLAIRFTRGVEGHLRLPLPEGQDSRFSIRMFPAAQFSGPLHVRLFVGDRPVGRCNIKRVPDSWCTFRVDARLIEPDETSLRLVSNVEIPAADLPTPLPGATEEAFTSFGFSRIVVQPIEGRDADG